MKLAIYCVGLLCIVLIGCNKHRDAESTEPDYSYVVAKDQIEAGRYLITVGGCNDCHTDGFLAEGMNIPEEDWLAGSPVGWHGPWGTTYPTNLRLRVQELDEEQWVKILKTKRGLPPMPWDNVNQISEPDARAIYAYIKSLGPKGERMPVAVAPNIIPETPYLSLFPQNMPGMLEE